jgi:predicted Mrr-cat superfamily restriction endonuclease
MKVGDLVRLAFAHKRENMIGIIVESVFNPLASAAGVRFNVVWCNGSLGKNVWDYDLVVINESR